MVRYEPSVDRNIDWPLREGSMQFEGISAAYKTLLEFVRSLFELNVQHAIAGGIALSAFASSSSAQASNYFYLSQLLSRIIENLGWRYAVPFIAVGITVDDSHSQLWNGTRGAHNEEY